MDVASLSAPKARWSRLLFLISAMVAIQQAAIADNPKGADTTLGVCQNDTLPKDIRDTLARRFDGWRIQDSTDLTPEARQRWASITPMACPGLATGHFEDLRSVAYAVLLVPSDRTNSGYELVMFSAPPRQSFYGFHILSQAEANANGMFIHSSAAEHVLDSAAMRRLRQKVSDAVVLALVENKTASQDVFVWKGDSYDRVQMDF